MASDQFISAQNLTLELLNLIKIQVPGLLFSWITSQSHALRYQVQWKLDSDERPNNWLYWGGYLLAPDFGADIKHKKGQENDWQDYNKHKVDFFDQWSSVDFGSSHFAGLQCGYCDFDTKEQVNI